MLSLLMAVGGSSPARADELTVNDGKGTSNYVPIYGYYVDTQNTTSEFIIPADRLEDLEGGTISQMTFYLSTPVSDSWENVVFEVYLKEVTATTYASATANTEGTNTVVYTGSLDGSKSTMVVPFSSNYVYGGGNLLVGFKVTTKGSYANTYFYGETFSYGTYPAFHSDGASHNERDNFLPKVTFEYTAGVGVMKKPKDVTASNILMNSATISWTAGGSETSWEVSYSTSADEPAADGSYTTVNTNSYELTGLTAGTTYYVYVRSVDGDNKSKWSRVCSFTPGVLTINNIGTTTNSYVPIYGNYMDSKSICQFVLPKESLTSLSGSQITKMDFYGTISTVSKLESHTFEIYMGEVADAAISSLADWTTLENVYTGSLTIADGKMTINFDGGFDYNGENLLIGFKQTDNGSDYSATTWTGVSATGASYGGYGSSASQRDFLPQISFYYAAQTTTVKKPKSLAASDVAATTAVLSWTDGEEGLTAWQIAYSDNADFDPDSEDTKVDADANPFTLTELTAATTYYAYVRAKKGEDYSAWSNKASFTTLAAAAIVELSATTVSMGMVSDADGQAQTFTISNTGGVALNNLSVSCDNANIILTDGEGKVLPTSLAANSSLTVKVKLNAVGQQSGTITISGDGIEAQTVTVSGYMLDNTKIAETFATAAPAHWTEYAYKSSYSTYSWTYSTDGAYNSNENSTLSTPKLTIAEGEALTIYAKLKSSASYGYLTVEGSEDNGENWTAYSKKLDYEAFGSTTNEFQVITLSDIPTTVNKLRFKCYYAYLNAVNGFTYAADPVLALYSDEECTTAQATPAAKNFGFITEAQTQTYYIKNTGTGQIDLEANEVSGFSVTITDAALIEGESTAVAISMAATEGLHDATLTVTAKNHDTGDVLGTFEVALNGAVAGSQNDVDFASLSELPAGWETTNWTVTANSYVGVGYTAGDLTTQTLTVGNGDVLLVEAKGSSSWSEPTLSYSYKAGDADWTEAQAISGVTYNDWKIFAITGIPAGDVKVKFNGQYTNIRRIYGFTAKVEPYMVFAEAGTTKNFGMITADATSDAYTITNSGAGVLNGLTVTCDNSNYVVTVTDSKTSIEANGGTATFTVMLKADAKGQQNGTVTISGTGVDSKTFNVSGYVADDSKIFETFASLPSRWTNSGWTFDANGATATSSSSKLESPKIVVTEGQKLAISAMQRYSGSSYYVTINGSSDNGATWTAYTKTLNNTQLNNTSYNVVELDDIPTTVNKLQFVGYYVYVNGLNGFTYDDNDPEFAMYSDEECTSKISTATATNVWGFVTEDKTVTYYIKNDGTGTMTLAATDAPAGFTATLGKNSLGTGESTSLVISMANADTNEGYHAGDVVLTATDSESNVLGTFTVTSSGVVTSASKTDINFTTLSDVPAGWEKGNWTVTANTMVAVSGTSGSLTTGTYTVAVGESMVIKAKQKYSDYGSLTYSYSTDNGENWSEAKTITPASTSYELIAISDIPVGTAKVKFTGTYIDIERIYGFTAIMEPAMVLSPAAATYDFDMQTADADYVITVTNDGTATMENLAATLESGADYTVAITIPEGSAATVSEGKATVPVGATATITVTQKFDATKGLASLSDVLTISADKVAAKTIALSGQTRDASKYFADFQSGLPTGWTNDNWYSNYSGTSYYMQTNYSGTSTMTTPALSIKAGETLSYDAWNSGSLTVRYTTDGGFTWTEAAVEVPTAQTAQTLSLGNETDVTAFIQFVGSGSIRIDNFYGGTETAAPMLSVTDGTTAIASGYTKAFGQILATTDATITIKNAATGTLTITSTEKTGDANVAVDKTQIGAGESATLTITMPVADSYGEKSGAVTVKTSLGDFVINYTATILNANALNVDFADNSKPAGWYVGGNWTISGGEAIHEASASADLITEQLTVAGTDDALTFQAARNSSTNAPTFKVYTSQNRVDWTEVSLGDLTLTTAYQDVTISGLQAGDYYVKISGARVKVDNFLGWTKKNNTRDLYVTATSFPTTAQTAGATISATATVTSLIAAEEGVYAKLFIDDEAVKILNSDDEKIDQTAAASVAKDGSTIFTVRYVLPNVNGTYTAQIKFYYSDASEAFATATSDITVDYPSLALYEMEDPTLSAGTYNVTLDHDFVAGWNTVCLPFEITASQIADGAKAYAFDSYNATTHVLNFTQATTLEAGKPYVVYTPEAITSDLQFSGVTIAEENVTAGNVESDGATFQGTYAKKAAGSMTGMYGVTSAAKIAKGTANASMRGFRAYFSLPANAPAPRMMFDGEIVTGISEIDMAVEDGQRVFDLQGRRVLNPKKGGMYIVGGKKVVVK